MNCVGAVAIVCLFLVSVSQGFHDERKDPFVSGQGGKILWLNMSEEFRHGHPMRPRVPAIDKATTMVLIAAYREHRCGRTLWDLFRKARYPLNVRVGVVDQRAGEDVPCIDQFCALWATNTTGRNPYQMQPPPGPCPYRKHVSVVDVDAAESKGPCFARAKAVDLLPERLPTFCMQTDSHMIFAHDWDVETQKEWLATENEFAVLTTYAANFFDLPASGYSKKTRDVPHLCQTIWGGHQFPRNQQASAAMWLPRAKMTNTWGAGLSYARCHFERTVPYDPFLYHIFDGEEYGRMARLWTHGYDTYTPRQNFVFHDYTHVKHFWTGDVSKKGVNVGEEEAQAVPRLETLFGMLPADSERIVDIEPYGLGKCRTYDQLVKFTGVETRHGHERTTSSGDQCGQLSWVPYDVRSCHDPSKFYRPPPAVVEGAEKNAEGGAAGHFDDRNGNDHPGGRVEHVEKARSSKEHAGDEARVNHLPELGLAHVELPELSDDPPEDDHAATVNPPSRLHARMVLLIDGLLVLFVCFALVSCRSKRKGASKRVGKSVPSKSSAISASVEIGPRRGSKKRAPRKFIKDLDSDEKKLTFEHHGSDHLRVSGVYWAVATLDLLDCLDDVDRGELVNWIVRCQHTEGPTKGGFGGNEGHDAHLLYTLSAVQVMLIFDALDLIDVEAVVEYVSGLQLPNGGFSGDQWGEVDTRFTYCAVSCLDLLGALDRIDGDRAVEFLGRCKNFDGAFGFSPEAESHAGSTFCCCGALHILGQLDAVVGDRDALGWWLTERQVPANGGFNGRPEKLSDVCYSWWVLSALAAIDRLDWFDRAALKRFILRAQDPVDGGIADREGDCSDVYHLFFGVAGLALMEDPSVPVSINPIYALTPRALERRRKRL